MLLTLAGVGTGNPRSLHLIDSKISAIVRLISISEMLKRKVKVLELLKKVVKLCVQCCSLLRSETVLAGLVIC